MTIQPTRVVQPPAEQSTISAETPKTTTKYPQVLPNGDILIDVIEKGTHKAELFKRTDPSQYIRYHVVCSCGVEGRFNDLDALKGFIEYHLRR